MKAPFFVWKRPNPCQEQVKGEAEAAKSRANLVSRLLRRLRIGRQSSTTACLEALIEFPNGNTELLLVTRVGPSLFQMEESSIFNEAPELHYHDVIEAKRVRGQGLRFLRLEKRSGLVTHSWLLCKSAIETPKVSEYLKGVVAAGGMWEQALGGMLMLHLPPSDDDRLVADLWKALAGARNA